MDPNGIGFPLTHMDELREAPNLPPEVLEKVKNISKLVPPEDLKNSPRPVEHCNCPFCQVALAIHGDTLQTSQNELHEEIVQDAELIFEEWTVSEKGEQLFEVQNKLDKNESYQVFLGTPLGCTCGKRDANISLQY